MFDDPLTYTSIGAKMSGSVSITSPYIFFFSENNCSIPSCRLVQATIEIVKNNFLLVKRGCPILLGQPLSYYANHGPS